jgi:CheY-like chemotaxis protein
MNKQYKILHVDDSPMFTSFLKELLSRRDGMINYKDVRSAEDALSELKENRPDLLIVDLMLSNDDDPRPGVEFIKLIKNQNCYKDLKIMVLTANLEKGPEKELQGLVSEYRHKNFTPSVFRQEIIDILSKGEIS